MKPIYVLVVAISALVALVAMVCSPTPRPIPLVLEHKSILRSLAHAPGHAMQAVTDAWSDAWASLWIAVEPAASIVRDHVETIVVQVQEEYTFVQDVQTWALRWWNPLWRVSGPSSFQEAVFGPPTPVPFRYTFEVTLAVGTAITATIVVFTIWWYSLLDSYSRKTKLMRRAVMDDDVQFVGLDPSRPAAVRGTAMTSIAAEMYHHVSSVMGIANRNSDADMKSARRIATLWAKDEHADLRRKDFNAAFDQAWVQLCIPSRSRIIAERMVHSTFADAQLAKVRPLAK